MREFTEMEWFLVKKANDCRMFSEAMEATLYLVGSDDGDLIDGLSAPEVGMAKHWGYKPIVKFVNGEAEGCEDLSADDWMEKMIELAREVIPKAFEAA